MSNLIVDISSKELQEYLLERNYKDIFLVTGGKSYLSSGAEKFMIKTLEGLEYKRFSDFDQNPKYEDVLRGLKLFEEKKFDAIIAIGGGSVMDMAKLINIFSANKRKSIEDILFDSRSIEKKGVPFIAMPTTSGTGSEATHFATLYYENKKYSVAHDFILPDLVGLNVKFTMTQSKYLTTCAGLDALSQAIESYWSVGSNFLSKLYAQKALKLLIDNLSESVHIGSIESRKSVMEGAYLAGRAINITKTTAPHAISYNFTTYFGIPHGHAVFLTLPSFFEFNNQVTESDLNDKRGVSYINETMKELCQILKVKNVLEGKKFLEDFASSLGMELSLNKLGINSKEDLELIINNINLERLKNNPRHLNSENLLTIFKII